MSEQRFEGTKLALFLGKRLAVIERDHAPDIPWPGFLDLPGGGRDGAESAETCVLRETREELGLVLEPGVLRWRRFYAGPTPMWFFVAHCEAALADEVAFGDEGLGWCLMRPEDYVAHDKAVPHFAQRVAEYLAG
ncbi:NUDIX domain protein [Roseovarius sp. THAF8]|uniref:NUDIX hydrolase n=1 Tax=Roseovarius sp. THAF8 TaxID=2587846 RepID=UPI001268DBE6|nr:NUDIX hydrolase [Roseovarius sp. THAF8]QFT98241.1 NUDIX domain protein [Roseovarius sp. THAF8]